MTDSGNDAPTIDEWRALYDVAIRVKTMAPWEWMTEGEIFGVQSPETDELGFVSIMGMAGEHYAVAVYRGAAGLHGFWAIENSAPLEGPERILEIPQLQASFENRDMLEPEDRAVIKQVGYKFRGRNEWPLFRSYRPGHVPWFLDADEARLLTHALEQTIAVAPRVADDRSLLEPGGEYDYLVRVADESDDAITWNDQIMEVHPPGPASLTLTVDGDMLDELVRDGRHVENTIEADFRMMPTPVEEEDDGRPYFPYLFLLVVSDDGPIVGMELLKPTPSLEKMWSRIPAALLEQLHNANVIPKEIRVRSDLLFQLLQPIADDLNVTVKRVRRLPSLEPAVESLFDHLM